LEDIFRLLIYLNTRAEHDDLYFQKAAGYVQRFEHDNALWELKLKIKQLQYQIVETYLLTINDVTENEKHDLNKWVADGNSVYDNPCLYCDTNGSPMDYISAMRILDDELVEMGLFQACTVDDEHMFDEINDLPF
jgi:hypothetical protein